MDLELGYEYASGHLVFLVKKKFVFNTLQQIYHDSRKTTLKYKCHNTVFQLKVLFKKLYLKKSA